MPDWMPIASGRKVFLRCEACGNAKIVPVEKTDPPGTVLVVTNECDICNAATGGFGQEWHFDADGNELPPNPPLA